MATRKQAGRIGGRRAGFRDYEALFKSEHLLKFTAGEIGFADPSPVSERCGGCIHWFVNPHSKWTPCEIMRLANNTPVPASGVCRFWNQDGRNYPVLNVL